jgi:hypothetical protein
VALEVVFFTLPTIIDSMEFTSHNTVIKILKLAKEIPRPTLQVEIEMAISS